MTEKAVVLLQNRRGRERESSNMASTLKNCSSLPFRMKTINVTDARKDSRTLWMMEILGLSEN